MDKKALEAAAKAIAANEIGGPGWASLQPETRHAYLNQARAAIEAYEAALWRPVSEHDGSSDDVMLEYAAPHGLTLCEPAWYDGDDMHKGWWPANNDWSDHYARSFEDRGSVPLRFRPLPSAPEGK